MMNRMYTFSSKPIAEMTVTATLRASSTAISSRSSVPFIPMRWPISVAHTPLPLPWCLGTFNDHLNYLTAAAALHSILGQGSGTKIEAF
ncbi:unnamed protein product [Colias eurytheme]|nr:unnamed protein product [Colias eurytheme]